MTSPAIEGKEGAVLTQQGSGPIPSGVLGGRRPVPQCRPARGRSPASPGAGVRSAGRGGRAGLRERIAWGLAGSLATFLAHCRGWL